MTSSWVDNTQKEWMLELLMFLIKEDRENNDLPSQKMSTWASNSGRAESDILLLWHAELPSCARTHTRVCETDLCVWGWQAFASIHPDESIFLDGDVEFQELRLVDK